MNIVQKYINVYLHKITTQNAMSVAIQIANGFWVEIISVHNLLADAIGSEVFE